MNIEELRNRGVFFHSTGDLFCYTTICLACGFREMGIPVFSGLDHSNPMVSDFEFKKTTEEKNPALILVDLREGSFAPDYPYHINSAHPHTHLIAVCDTVDHLNYTGEFPVHRAHTNHLISKNYRSFPLGFGVSEKLRDYSLSFKYPAEREQVVIKNFRPSRNQFVRLSLELSLVPIIEQLLPIDRRFTSSWERWDTSHLDRLGSSLMCLAYGGNYQDDYSVFWEREVKPTDPRYEFLTQRRIFQTPVVTRWDSWRFWESISMGCLTIQLDFDKYGFELPVMPENWVHYVGVSLDTLKEDVERLMDERDRIPEVTKAGQEWALKHYTPRPVAERFLRNAGVDF
jgi:hypothetical protein